jgi:hypothetical protein
MKSNCWSVLLHREADNDGPPQRAPFRHLLGAATNALLRETESAYRAITNEHYLQSRASLSDRMALCGFAAETHHATGTAANAAMISVRRGAPRPAQGCSER